MISVPIAASVKIPSETQTARLNFIVSIKNCLETLCVSLRFIIKYYLIITRNMLAPHTFEWGVRW